jgi:hypothetical protein
MSGAAFAFAFSSAPSHCAGVAFFVESCAKTLLATLNLLWRRQSNPIASAVHGGLQLPSRIWGRWPSMVVSLHAPATVAM